MSRTSGAHPSDNVASQRDRISEVDGLRAIAMTMVVAQHCNLLPFGWVGVWLFYAISGLVITMGFIAEEREATARSARLGAFMLRRVARIVPIYLLFVAVNTLILLALFGPSRLGDLPYLLGFVYNWHMVFDFPPGSSAWSPFGHLWTLSVEEQFYLLYPALALFAPARTRLPAMLTLVLIGPLVRLGYGAAIAGINPDPGWRAFATYASSICQIDAFLVGALVAHGHMRGWLTHRRSQCLWALAGFAASIYAVTYVCIHVADGKTGMQALRNVFSGILYGNSRELFVYTVVNLVSAAVLVHAILGQVGSRLLKWPPLVRVGQASYGAYLFHTLVLWCVTQVISADKDSPLSQRVLVLLTVWMLTVVLALVSFHRFEVPVRRWLLARWRVVRAASSGPGLASS